jgi:hypothetical protein
MQQWNLILRICWSSIAVLSRLKILSFLFLRLLTFLSVALNHSKNWSDLDILVLNLVTKLDTFLSSSMFTTSHSALTLLILSGIEQVDCVSLLGVTNQSNRHSDSRLAIVPSVCSQQILLKKILKYHGSSSKHLFTVFYS